MAVESINELYMSHENRYLVSCLESTIIQGLEMLASAKCRSFNSKEARAGTSDLSSTYYTQPGDKELSGIHNYLRISNRRKHLFCLSSKLQNLKIVQLKKNSMSQDDLEEELQLVDKESKVCYLKQRIEKLKSSTEFTEKHISNTESQRVDVANIDNLLKKQHDIIYRLHEENEILLRNLTGLCRETKHAKQKLLDQLIVTRKIVGELICTNLLGDINGIIQGISFNPRAFQSGNNFVDILCTDSLYVSCCNLYSLEPSFQSPDVLLRCMLLLIQESWLAENSFELLHYVLMNLDEEFHTSVKLQKYDVKLHARDLKHLLPCIARLKLLIQEVEKRMSSYDEFVSNWKKLPIRTMLL
uniref:SJCHGC00713 protein n=1 Tax=Schistosoma japonicum TaxID=6182 RepID=Q5DHD8_SCHJA|nr:SJCHGC00713 protein [Schistosoma japonicum]